MTGAFISVLLFAVPIGSIIFFVVSLVLFLSARSANKENPGTYTESQINTRKVLLIVSSILAFVVVSVVITIISLLYMAVAYM